jgi:hypothetical protein
MRHGTAARRRCNTQRAPMQRAARADALCNMRRAPMHRATCTGAASTDATCNMRRAPMQHATRADASMPHASMRHVDATYKEMYCSDATRADATRIARRCNAQRAPMQHAHRIQHGASCTACIWAAPGRHVASAHSMPRCMHPPVWKARDAVHDERRRSVQRTPCARRCAALRVPMGSPLRQRFETRTHMLHSGRMRPYAVHHSPQHACAAPCAPSIGRAAPRNIPYHGAGTRNSRWAHAPPRWCSRSSRP